MKTLYEYIVDAGINKKAIGHFNISNIEMLWGVFNGARNYNFPVIIGVSEGERELIGVKQAVAIIESIRDEYDYPIFLNADHTYSIEKMVEAIDAGFDMVIYDGAKLSFEENLKNTKECVRYADEVFKKTGRRVLIEGEIGYIGQSSKVLDSIPEGVDLKGGLTSPDQAKKFKDETGIDLLAPAVGNIHGMLRIGHDPNLDISRIKDIKEAVKIPLVLHGGSGTTKSDFVKAIEAGISIVHISTELRVAYRGALVLSLQENPDEVAPYKYVRNSINAVEKIVSEKLKLFNQI